MIMTLIVEKLFQGLKIILLLITIYKFCYGQIRYINSACEYPGCKCKQLVWDRRSFSMDCTTSSSDAVILPRNRSINIVHLSIYCIENTNLTDLLQNIRHDLAFLKSLTLMNCQSPLYDIINVGKLQKLNNLTIKDGGENLSDRYKLNLGLANASELMFLTISDSLLTEVPSLCSLPQLTSLNLSGNLLKSFTSPYRTCQGISKSKLKFLDLSRNRIAHLEPLRVLSLTDLYLGSNFLDQTDFTAFSNLTELRTLDISNNSITALPDSLLINNKNLRVVKLSFNFMAVLHKTSFAGFTKLEHLDLSHNNLTSIESGIFEELGNLTRLDLGCNSVTVLPYDIFDPLISLQRLDLKNNSLTEVPPLTSLSSLEVLNLRNNKIERLARNTFKSLTSLQGIGLRGNSLRVMEFDTFDFSPQLAIVDLSYNNISSLVDGMNTKKVLSNLAQVFYLRLDNNRIEDVSIIGVHFVNLNFLFLDNNKIKIVPKNSLPNTLNIVSLSDNSIFKIEIHTFKYMKQLQTVTLHNNSLSTLPQLSVEVHPRLEPKPKFYIGRNIFYCDCNMAYLKAWDTAHTRIRALHSYYPDFSDLDYVYCTTVYSKEITRFRDVPMSQFACEYILGRFCDHGCECCLEPNCSCDYVCPDKCTCYHAGSRWTNEIYDKTDCDNRSLSKIPENIPLSTTLLYLGNNDVHILSPKPFSLLNKVRCLFLNHSGIQHIDIATLRGMNKLVFIYLDHNSISEILNGSFTGLQNLKELHLENNKISYIEDEAFSMLKSLRYLFLENNCLNTISSSIFSSLEHPPVITLMGNPWSCYCQSMAVLKQFMNQYGSLVQRAHELRCDWLLNKTSGAVQNYSFQNDYRPSILVLEYNYDIECSDNATVTVFVKRVLDDGRHVAALVSLIVVVVLLLSALTVAYWKRRELQALVFVRFGVRIVDKNKNINDAGRKYDAFLSYSSKDEHIVVHELAPKLEGGGNPYKLCLHYRDFPVGECIADTIVNSIEDSKRTLMLLSENFLGSEWCRYEFQTAHHHVLKENTHRLIMVLLHDLDPARVDPDLRVHLKDGNYLRYNDPWFWEKLYFALPDRKAELLARPDDGIEDNDDVFYPDDHDNIRQDELHEEHRL